MKSFFRIILSAAVLAMPALLLHADSPPPAAQPAENSACETSAIAAMKKKLKRIVIPKIEFKEATVKEALELLRKRSVELDEQELDPAQKGVNIVLKLDESEPSVSAPVPDVPADSKAPAVPKVTPTPVGGGEDVRITLALTNVPLLEALKYVTALANLKYKVDPLTVTVTPIGTAVGQDFVTMEWRLRPDQFERIGGDGNAEKTALAPIDAAPMTSKDRLIAAGVEFPAGTIAIYSKKTGTLTVKNTQENLDLIDEIVESLQK